MRRDSTPLIHVMDQNMDMMPESPLLFSCTGAAVGGGGGVAGAVVVVAMKRRSVMREVRWEGL